ncbi:queuosine 5'-phosphate N-glycosylase/hydrolase isoform X2 [Parasteatoda tepidariorum]|uniref:queuosine 5'-phosphate N-glycosylase/hydrolase isoform X2 n=1 Tax=Parasteatoda tepidariorum TaxID=114398 RepID=UPI001C727874|nr:queuosine salvage protein isoform X2 [Parasteatoda tepidariorum]
MSGNEQKPMMVKESAEFISQNAKHVSISDIGVEKAAESEGFDILSPKFYSVVSMDTLKHIFRSDSGKEIPMLEERHKVLIETGRCLIEKFGGSFKNCVELCKNNAMNLLNLIIENFPSYKDEALYEGKLVSFYKRAQILIGDIWACFEGQGLGYFEDIHNLAIFADYRIPQVLAHMKVLIYSEDLYQKLEKGIEMKNGDSEEVEIRGCTIWAVELILQRIKKLEVEGKDILFNSILIDHYLWEHRRKHAEEMSSTPFHRVRCIYY